MSEAKELFQELIDNAEISYNSPNNSSNVLRNSDASRLTQLFSPKGRRKVRTGTKASEFLGEEVSAVNDEASLKFIYEENKKTIQVYNAINNGNRKLKATIQLSSDQNSFVIKTWGTERNIKQQREMLSNPNQYVKNLIEEYNSERPRMRFEKV